MAEKNFNNDQQDMLMKIKWLRTQLQPVLLLKRLTKSEIFKSKEKIQNFQNFSNEKCGERNLSDEVISINEYEKILIKYENPYVGQDIIIEEKIIPNDMPISCEESNLNHTDTRTSIVNISESSSISTESQNDEKRKRYIKCKCGKIYFLTGNFKNHKKICQKFQNQNLFICRKYSCHQTFTTILDYEKHKTSDCKRNICIKKKLKNDIFPCKFEGCSQKFTSNYKLSIHKQTDHNDNEPFACQFCNQGFKSKNQQEKHEKSVHLKRSKLHEKKVKKSKDFKNKYGATKAKTKPETEIGKKIEINQDLDDSSKEKKRVTRSRNKDINFTKFFEQEIKNEKIFDKNVQNISISEDTDSSTSFDEANSDNEIAKSKKICKNFARKVDDHSENSEKVSVKRQKLDKNCLELKCEYENCSQIFNSYDKYNYHINSVHLNIRYESQSNENSFCFLCRKRLLKKYLEEHMTLPHKIKCLKCAMIFVESAQLERHTAFVHTDPNLKKWQCSKCSKRFVNNVYLQNHQRKVHLKKIKTCPFCLDKISTLVLKRHLETHKFSGVRKSKEFCQVCQIYLFNYEKLIQHKKTELHLRKISVEIKEDNSEEYILPDDVHSIDSILAQNTVEYKARKYRTKDKGILNPEDLDKMKPNSKRAVRTCVECGLKFRNYLYWKRHMESDHGHEKPLVYCEICDVAFERKTLLNLHLKKSKSHKRKELETQSQK